jgi:signal transduction histidine kinase/ligand-binding sensor domain-containing protein
MSIRTSVGAVGLALALAAQPAAALDAKVRLAQYRHTAWRVQEGAFESAPNVVAQTADGYIWIGTNSGLVRFDGVRFQPWTPPQKNLSATAIVSLLSASDGTFWIGTATGLLSWKNDRLEEHLSGRIAAILEDHKRRIWVARSLAESSGALCQVVGDDPGCIRRGDRLPLLTAAALAEDVDGNLWVGASNQVMRWRDGSMATHLTELAGYTVSSVTSLAAAPDGSVWAAIPRDGFGVFRTVNSVPVKAVVQGLDTTQITTLFVDRDRSLWMGTPNDGVYRLAAGRVDHFRTEHGLSSNTVTGFFEDREGNMWLATAKGLDCLRESPIVTFSTTNGLPPGLSAMLASVDGTIWIGSPGHLVALRGDSVTSVQFGARSVNALWQDHAGRLWVGFENLLTVYEDGRFRTINRLDGSPLGTPIAIAEDRDQNIWVSVGITTTSDRKLFRIRDMRVQEELAPNQVPLARRVAGDPTGGIWLVFEDGNLGHYQNGNLEIFPLAHSAAGASAPRLDSRTSSANADTRFPSLTIDADGSVWVATWNGLVRWKNREVKTLSSKNGLPCDAIVSAIRDAHGALWLYTKCGFIAIDDRELEHWWRQPDRVVKFQVLDALDGAVLPQGPKRLQPIASQSPDGRLWFVNETVLQVVDPGRLTGTAAPPPIYVEDVRADRKDYAVEKLVRLPARSRDVEIGYTALSFSSPQKIRFRYRLDGRDRDWQDAGTRRRAFYSDLPPGQYTFRVTASNNNGVWNDRGAVLAFAILPAFYQTSWFRSAGVAATVLLLWAAYQMRLRQVAHEFDVRLRERINERTRIARDLHDTLLQSFHGLLFHFQAANNMLPDRPVEAKQQFESAIDHAAQALTEGRDAVQSLRSAVAESADLAEAITVLSQELAASDIDGGRTPPVVGVAVEGMPRALHPALRDDVHRIVSEALRNAFQHAHPRRIEVEIRYEEHLLRVRVRDDGSGIDLKGLDRTRKHFGLSGMRERASLIGGRLDVWSQTGSGTEVDLKVPGRAAYTASATTRSGVWPFLSRLGRFS